MSDSALLTNSTDDPNVAAEFRAEIESANAIDLLCAFVRWTGLRLLHPALEELKERGAKLRVITTTHMGGRNAAPSTNSSTDAFFVTLNKDDKKHSATTMYKDYALSPELFNWESKNATSPGSPTGRRYLDRDGHGSRILIFTRDTSEDETGLTVPYTCRG